VITLPNGLRHIPSQTWKLRRALAEEFIPRYGVPEDIHSDQGHNFEMLLFKEIGKILRMEKTRTTPLRPQSDGMVEHFSKFVSDNLRDWNRHLPQLNKQGAEQQGVQRRSTRERKASFWRKGLCLNQITLFFLVWTLYLHCKVVLVF